MMNPVVKEKWLAALRSGKYEQGQQLLRLDDPIGGQPPDYRYCCLGVLCDISPVGGWNGGGNYECSEIDCSGVRLPEGVRSWACLSANLGVYVSTAQLKALVPAFGPLDPKAREALAAVDGEGISISLAQMNDKGFTFEQIALVIEAYL